MELFDASGAAMRLRASPLFAIGPSAPGPALRRGALVAVPVGAAMLLELGLDSPTKGAIGTGALLAGFPGLDAPARTRAAWQATVAPLVGLAAVLGVLSGENAFLAVATMALVGAAAGYCFAVSLRFAIFGLSVALSLLIAQGLPLDPADALPALLLATAGGLLQAAFSLAVWAAGDREEEGGEEGWDRRAALAALRANLSLRATPFRHALRFGAALAAGVAAYWLLGMEEHGFWIPLTMLFVLRPEEDETFHRLILRAIGTAAGLVLATALAEWLSGDGVAIAVALTLATAFAYGLLTVQYALFTTAITVYAVLLADSIGAPALRAAGPRALATAIGIAIAGLAFLLWPNQDDSAIFCKGQEVDDGLLYPPTKTESGTALAQLLFSECTSFVAGETSPACKPAEPITFGVTGLLIKHKSRSYILFEPDNPGGQFTEIQFPEECPLENTLLVGRFVMEDGNGPFEEEAVKHLLTMSPSALFAGQTEEGQQLPNSSVAFGIHPAKLELFLWFKLAGANAGKEWSGLAL